jgi:DNA-directed RNA polymerase specialized sigma24 family protein
MGEPFRHDKENANHDAAGQREDPHCGKGGGLINRPGLRRISLNRHRLVRIALDALPERQRLALVLVYHQDLRDREAAELMGTSVEAFEFLMARAEGSGGGSTR